MRPSLWQEPRVTEEFSIASRPDLRGWPLPAPFSMTRRSPELIGCVVLRGGEAFRIVSVERFLKNSPEILTGEPISILVRSATESELEAVS